MFDGALENKMLRKQIDYEGSSVLVTHFEKVFL